jgi:hypothetical protein
MKAQIPIKERPAHTYANYTKISRIIDFQIEFEMDPDLTPQFPEVEEKATVLAMARHPVGTKFIVTGWKESA